MTWHWKYFGTVVPVKLNSSMQGLSRNRHRSTPSQQLNETSSVMPLITLCHQPLPSVR